MDSTRLLTGSSDSTAKLWEVETGNCLHTFKFQSPCRAVSFSIDEQMAALSTDPFMAQEPAINLVRMAQDPADQTSEVVQQLTGFSKRITRVAFTDANAVLVTAGEDGYVRRWDLEVITRSYHVAQYPPMLSSGSLLPTLVYSMQALKGRLCRHAVPLPHITLCTWGSQ